MNSLETLEAARALIAEPSRWTKGAYARADTGCALEWDTKVASSYCLIGALKAASGSTGMGYVTAIDILMYMVLGVLANGHSSEILFNWNDDPHRTHTEVLALLDEAIRLVKKSQ